MPADPSNLTRQPDKSNTVVHTRGPWRVFEHRDSSGLCIGPPYEEPYFTDGEVADVCTISGGRRNGVTDQQRANARLIAAAPCLLEALKGTLAILEGPTPPAAEMFAAIEAARQAIQRAEGAEQ